MTDNLSNVLPKAKERARENVVCPLSNVLPKAKERAKENVVCPNVVCPNLNIKAIIHLADLHIRSGDMSRSKYEQYENTFTNLISQISQEEHIKTGECITVIAGDIFHYKNEADSTGIKLFNYLIGGLAKLCPVLLIQGNHDYKQGKI